jgi:ABC-type amino acid transport substrate-binding protein
LQTFIYFNYNNGESEESLKADLFQRTFISDYHCIEKEVYRVKRWIKQLVLTLGIGGLWIGLMAISVVAEEVPLMVGITPDYPPLIFRQGETLTGIEVDLARKLGQELNRPVRLVTLKWEEQIDALLGKKIDLIMSGMSITPTREIRIRFGDPYLKSGLVAAFRAEDIKKYETKEGMLKGFAVVAAARDTTGDIFLKREFSRATRKVVLPKAGDAVSELKRRSIDIFIHDAPYILWMVSQNEADLAALWEPLNQEALAWGIRKDDDVLLSQVNSALKKWRGDGTLEAVLLKWLPGKYLNIFK